MRPQFKECPKCEGIGMIMVCPECTGVVIYVMALEG
jgi:DnaJ-class molecular chaperone